MAEKVERQEIWLECFPNWEGASVRASLKANDEFKYAYDAPLPETEEDAQELYNVSLSFLISKGVQGLTHTVDRTEINERADQGEDPEDEAFCIKLAESIPTALKITPRVMGAKAEKSKKAISITESLMIKLKASSLEELEEKIKAMKS